jgi:hypothetical protein
VPQSAPKVISQSGPLNYTEYQSFDVGTYLIVGSNYTEMIVVMSLSNNPSLHGVSGYAVPSVEEGPVSEPSHSDPKGNMGGVFHPTSGPIVNGNMVPIQSSEAAHAMPLAPADFSNNVAMTGQPPAAKMPTVAPTNPFVATTVQKSGFSYTDRIVRNATPVILSEVPLAGNLLVAGFDATTNMQQLVASHQAGLVTFAHAGTSDWPVQKASLVGMPLNIKGVEQALEKVMGELGHLGTAFSSWLDARHLTGAAVAVTVITVGAGTAVYLRRRGSKQGRKRDEEEASSSWLFARLQSAPEAS